MIARVGHMLLSSVFVVEESTTPPAVTMPGGSLMTGEGVTQGEGTLAAAAVVKGDEVVTSVVVLDESLVVGVVLVASRAEAVVCRSLMRLQVVLGLERAAAGWTGRHWNR